MLPASCSAAVPPTSAVGSAHVEPEFAGPSWWRNGGDPRGHFLFMVSANARVQSEGRTPLFCGAAPAGPHIGLPQAWTAKRYIGGDLICRACGPQRAYASHALPAAIVRSFPKAFVATAALS